MVFYVTLIVYLSGVLLSASAWDFWSFAIFRMITGLGIGGEYAAVNSAIDELIPAKYRGRIDLVVNGSFWLGAAMANRIRIGLESKCRLYISGHTPADRRPDRVDAGNRRGRKVTGKHRGPSFELSRHSQQLKK